MTSAQVEPEVAAAEAKRIVSEYYTFSGTSHNEFKAHISKVAHQDILRIDHEKRNGVKGIKSLLGELERVKGLGISYLKFEIHSLAVDGKVTLSKRTDFAHAEDGTIVGKFDVLGTCEVANSQVIYVKDYYFEPTLYNSVWYKTSSIAELSSEEVVRAYFSTNGPTIADFEASSRKWLTDDVVWIDRRNVTGVKGIEAVIEELRRAAKLGVGYMSFDILGLAVVNGDTVMTHRNDKVHGLDGAVIANLEMMGLNTVKNGKIIWGKDYHFEVEAYDSSWNGS